MVICGFLVKKMYEFALNARPLFLTLIGKIKKMSVRLNLTKQRFGRLLVVCEAGRTKQKGLLWECQCDCGKKVVVSGNSLMMGKTKSCGCLQRERSLKTHTKHGMTGTLFHTTWKNIRERCSNTKIPAYAYYGGRGIKVCNRWLDFANFKNDMYDSYTKHKAKYQTTTIERMNNDGNYCPKNCCWATRKEQVANRRPSFLMKQFQAKAPNGKIFESNNQRKFAEEHNLQSSAICQVLKGNGTHHKNWTFHYT